MHRSFQTTAPGTSFARLNFGDIYVVGRVEFRSAGGSGRPPEGVRNVVLGVPSRGGSRVSKTTTILLVNVVPYSPVAKSSTKVVFLGSICSVFTAWEGVGEGCVLKGVVFCRLLQRVYRVAVHKKTHFREKVDFGGVFRVFGVVFGRFGGT